MCLLEIKGMPAVDEGILEQLIGDLQEGVASIRELNLLPSQVTVTMPVDRVQKGLGEELICLVFGLFDKPERTFDVRVRLAKHIYFILARFARGVLPQCGKVEVFPSRFNPDKEGYAEGDPRKL